MLVLLSRHNKVFLCLLNVTVPVSGEGGGWSHHGCLATFYNCAGGINMEDPHVFTFFMLFAAFRLYKLAAPSLQHLIIYHQG